MGLTATVPAPAQVLASARQAARSAPQTTSTRSLKTVLTELERRYNVSIVYEEAVVSGKYVAYPVGGGEKVEKALAEVLRPVGLKFRRIEPGFYAVLLPRKPSVSSSEPRAKAVESADQSALGLVLPSALNAVVSPGPAILATRQAEERIAATVTGRVSDEAGQGIPGVNVRVKDGTQGTTSNGEGRYSLNVPEGATTLLFSSIGYENQEIVLGGRTTLDVTMKASIGSLDEVVVVGYGTQQRATITGSVSSVKGAELQQSPATNVSNSLAGRLPGLVTVTPSSEPGADASTIRIRGVNSLGNNDPLVVVDGVPGRSLDRLDPNSIESLTVLKDASAAIYGAQAANGVILITTKRGKLGKPEISLNLNQGFGAPTRIPQMTDAAEYATLLNEIEYYKSPTNYVPKYTPDEIQKFQNGSDPWKYPNTDWFKEVLKPWSAQGYNNLTINGGSEAMRYFISVGARSQDGFYKNSATKYNQYDFRSNLDGRLSKYVSIGFDIAGRLEDRNYPVRSAGSIFRMVLRGKPQMPAYWPNGTPGPDIEYGDNPAVVSTDATGYDHDKWYILQNTLRLTVQIPGVTGLSFTSNVGLDKGYRFRKRFETPWYLYSWDGQSYDANKVPVLVRGKKGFDDPRLSQETEDRTNWLINGLINYERSFSQNHLVKFMVGMESRTGKRDLFSAYRRYFVTTAVDQLFGGGDLQKDNGGTAYQEARLNYFGRVNYAFKEKYLAELVWRYDGSYIFPALKRYGFFPGVSVGWRLSEEEFWKNSLSSVVNSFKLRASWGQTGNDRIDPYQYLSSYAFGGQPYIFGGTVENKALYEARIPNQNVTWEIANQANIGFEALLLNSKLSIEADYFNNVRSQILWWRNASTPGSTGLTLPRENIGKVGNKGFDFSIGYRDHLGELKYQVMLNGGYQRNTIKFWDESPGAPEYQQSTGRPIPTDPFNPNNDLYYQSIGIFRDQAAIDAQPHWDGARPGDVIFADVNGDGKIDANDRVRNQFTNIPRFTGGFSLNLQWRAFDLSVLFQGAAGAVQYIQTESGEIGNFLQSFYDARWTKENPDASGPRTFNRTNEYWMNNRNTYFLHRTDYVRLKNLQLGFNVPGNLTQKIGMQGARIYVSGLNLFTLSPNFKDFDPETNTSSGQGYPSQKVLNGGLTLTF